MNSYDLSRKWFNYCFDNPEKIRPIHSAIFFFAIEHCNRLGWKDKFGFPSQMVMEALGVRNWRTYSKALDELEEFGFITMVEKSKNQYSSNIIAIVKNTKAPTKALDKALQKHSQKQGQSIASIDKQGTKNKEQYTIEDYFSNTRLCDAVKKHFKLSDSDFIKAFEEFSIEYLGRLMSKEEFDDACVHFKRWINKNRGKWEVQETKAERQARFDKLADQF